jgi:hypothetical protein
LDLLAVARQVLDVENKFARRPLSVTPLFIVEREFGSRFMACRIRSFQTISSTR